MATPRENAYRRLCRRYWLWNKTSQKPTARFVGVTGEGNHRSIYHDHYFANSFQEAFEMIESAEDPICVADLDNGMITPVWQVVQAGEPEPF